MLDWVAIDDDAEHFPEAILRTRVVLSDSTKGFRAQAASQLWRMLSARAERLRNAARKTP